MQNVHILHFVDAYITLCGCKADNVRAVDFFYVVDEPRREFNRITCRLCLEVFKNVCMTQNVFGDRGKHANHITTRNL